MKKKVCILQNGLAWGGTDTFVINLCKGLDKSKYDVYVINPDTGEKSIRDNEVIEAGANLIYTTPLKGIKGRLIHLFKLYKILKENKFDVFHTNIDLFNGPNLLIAWIARVPMRICHSHNALQSRELIKGRSLGVRLYQNITRWMCWTFSNRRIGCSDLANDFLYKNKDWKVASYPTVIFNGIDLQKFKISKDKNHIKQSLGINEQYALVTIGHFIEQKNPFFTAKLISELCKKRDDIALIWIGEGKLKNAIEKYITDLGIKDKVFFLGNRKDIPEVLHSADVFILPSNFEGMPIVSIEAQAAGLPTLLSENISHIGNCDGIKFLPIDQGVAIWENYVCDILSDKLILEVSEEKLKKFSIKYMINQMISVFES